MDLIHKICQRVHRNQLPYQSLLKLSGKQFCNKYSSTLIKAYGPAAIFSLSSNKQNLCQLNYHHEGGVRYYFTQHEILCEAIHFALPSWFYNEFSKNSSLCHCKLSSNLKKDESIDLNLYNHETIQRYIQKYLQLNTHQKDFGNDIFMDNNRSESANYEQIPNMIDTPSSSNDQSINEEIIKRNNKQYKIDVKKILYLSNLNKQITKNDLRSYFIGLTKIILKQSQLPPYLNYVFIFHRTNLQTEYSRKRANSSSRFGSNSQIEFVKNYSELSNENKLNEKWNIVTENDFKKLFFNSDKIKYISARIV
ncbi:unnamed protein product [Adineta steineri]|uniref:Uncharacterized protein n=1 Tax=Adineta steineri TaxID=433720 RepID=A0A814F5Y8_9BILA|nr:unnamed protein product [Adineta steineri]